MGISGRTCFRLTTLGALALAGDEGPLAGAAAQRRSLALLALLALGRNKGVSRDKLVAYLWPESNAERAHHALSQLLYALRRDVGQADVASGATELRLNRDVISVDLDDFEAALARRELEGAVAAYGGPLLDGFHLGGAPEFERLVESERAALAKRMGAALEGLADAASRAGDHAAAAAWWRRLAALDPLSSRVALALMRALVAAGDRGGALQHARDHARIVRAELDAAPDALVTAFVAELRRTPLPPPRQHDLALASIAVLPFANLGPDPDTEYVSDGITEELINALTRVAGLRVAARMSVFAFKGSTTDVRDIAARLSVGAVLQGSVRKAGTRLRIAAQLINAVTGYHLWSETYDRELNDMFAVQDELARAIAGKLAHTLIPQAQAPLVRRSTSSMPAYMLYLRGQHYLAKRTEEGFRKAIQFFEIAIESDPAYPLAYAGLANAYALFGFDDYRGLPPALAMPRGKAAALHALELDATLADPHAALGWVSLFYEWDWGGAERAFQRAITLKPNLAVGHHWYALYLMAMGRADESIAEMRQALALDPLFPIVPTDLGRAFAFARRYDEAVDHYRLTLEMDPGFLPALFELSRVLALQGDIEEARAVCRAASAAAPDSVRPLLASAWVEARAGAANTARALLAELGERAQRQYVSPYYLACACAALGDRDRAFEHLARGCDERMGLAVFTKVGPMLDGLRDDPRFAELLKRIGLA
jgi:adenylate cyclase